MFLQPRLRRLSPAAVRARSSRPGVERMEDRQLLATLLGLTDQNELIRFDSGAPGTVQATTPITGLGSGESILGIDYRPATGQLYGVSSANQVYVINASSGVATAVGSAFSATLAGSKTAIDFNPVPDRIRVVTDGTSNIRLNPITGGVGGTDTNLAYASSDAGSGTTPMVTAVAYTNSIAGATTTTLFGIDQARGVLVTQGSAEGVTPVVSPNTGQLFTVGSLGIALNATGLDIAANEGNDFGKAFVTGTTSGSTTPTLFTVDLATGAATSVGAIGVTGRSINDVAVVPRIETIFAVAAADDAAVGGTTLVSFASNNPGQLLTNQAITGLQSGESILDIDVRPATGQLYGLGSTGRVYTIDTATAAATLVGSGPAFTPTGRAAIDFNPVPDRIRVVTASGQNLRLNPDTGAIAGTDTDVAYATGDANFGVAPTIAGVAYTNSIAGATGTTLYAFDSAILTTQGSLQGVTPVVSPNTGQLFTVATSTATPTGFDIAAARNVAYVATAGATSGLAAINLTTGAATTVGTIGSGLVIRGLAVAPTGTFGFSVTSVSVDESSGSAVITVTRTGGSSGEASVDFATADGTGVAGTDYTATSGTLVFADGETSKTINVPLIDNPSSLDDASFTLNLTNATAGASVPAVGATTTVTVNNTTPPPPPVDATSPTVSDVAIRTNGSQRVSRILVTFSEAMNASTITTANVVLLSAGRDGRPGTPDDRPLAIQSITFDAATNTATIVPRGRIKLGQKFGLAINGGTGGVTDTAGNRLDGAGTGTVGSNFFAGLALSNRLRYIDADGDRVEIKVKNGGVAELRLNGDGTTRQVRLLNTRRGRTRVTGDVDRKRGGNGTVFIGTLTGTQGVRLKLSNREFRLGTVG